MKPVILEFQPKSRGDGTYELGVVTAGFTLWTSHFGFVDGKPVATLIGVQNDPPPPSISVSIKKP